jgi:hypothetical protein
MNEDLKKRLETYAYQKSTAFCYLCYCEAGFLERHLGDVQFLFRKA